MTRMSIMAYEVFLEPFLLLLEMMREAVNLKE